MNHSTRRRLTFAASLALLFLAAAMTAAAQYYPPPPPPYPPPYPPRTYPRQPNYPPQYPGNRDYRNSGAYFSPYAMFSAGHYSGLGVGNGTAPTQSGGLTALGGTFGGDVLYASPSPIRAGIDGRLIVENSANSTQFGNKILAGLIGFRVDGSGAHLPVVPYFQFEVGGAGTNNGTSTTRTGSFAYQAQFGADFPLMTPQVSARVEYGAGQLTGINSTNHTLQTFSAGIVFHIR